MTSARRTLQVIARRAMTERGLAPGLPSGGPRRDRGRSRPAPCNGPSIRDLRGLLWCSIDNDDSRDLDQLTVAEPLARRPREGAGRDRRRRRRRGARLGDRSPRARPTRRRSTPRPRSSRCSPSRSRPTSRRSTRARTGSRSSSRWSSRTTARWMTATIFRAAVRNRAKLAYRSVAAWLDGDAPAPAATRVDARARGAAPAPGPGRAGDEGAAAPARRADARDDRGQGRVRRRRCSPTCCPTRRTARRS